MPANGADPESKEKDIAKYFVPASIIRAFIPTDRSLFREFSFARTRAAGKAPVRAIEHGDQEKLIR